MKTISNSGWTKSARLILTCLDCKQTPVCETYERLYLDRHYEAEEITDEILDKDGPAVAVWAWSGNEWWKKEHEEHDWRCWSEL